MFRACVCADVFLPREQYPRDTLIRPQAIPPSAMPTIITISRRASFRLPKNRYQLRCSLHYRHYYRHRCRHQLYWRTSFYFSILSLTKFLENQEHMADEMPIHARSLWWSFLHDRDISQTRGYRRDRSSHENRNESSSSFVDSLFLFYFFFILPCFVLFCFVSFRFSLNKQNPFSSYSFGLFHSSKRKMKFDRTSFVLFIDLIAEWEDV